MSFKTHEHLPYCSETTEKHLVGPGLCPSQGTFGFLRLRMFLDVGSRTSRSILPSLSGESTTLFPTGLFLLTLSEVYLSQKPATDSHACSDTL